MAKMEYRVTRCSWHGSFLFASTHVFDVGVRPPLTGFMRHPIRAEPVWLWNFIGNKEQITLVGQGTRSLTECSRWTQVILEERVQYLRLLPVWREGGPGRG